MAQEKHKPVNTKSHFSNDPVVQYMCDHTLKLTSVQEKLIKATSDHPLALMLASADELQFLANLVKSIRGKKTLDVGVFTGYSALSIALALPEDGTVIGLDISDEFATIGKPFWKEAGVDNKIDLMIAPAVESLGNLIKKGHCGTFDFAFIDADKQNYSTYYELCLQLIRPGGIIAIDNVMWRGKVMDPDDTEADTEAIRTFNRMIKDDDRVDVSMLRIGDGLTLAFKK